MKICLINNLYEPFNRGGAEKIVKLMAEKFSSDGHNILIISTKPFGQETPQKTEFKAYFLNSFFYYLNKIPVWLRIFWHLHNIFNLKNYFKIKKILRQEKPDVVIAHNLIGLGFLTPCAIRQFGTMYVQYLHDIQLLHPSGLMYFGQENKILNFPAKIYQLIISALFASPDLVISPSQWLLDLQSRFFSKSKKIHLLSPALLTQNQAIMTKEKKDYFHFFFVGQIEEHKGVIFLVNTFLNIPDKNIKLTLIGNGIKFEELNRLIASDQRLKLIPWPGDEKMRKAIAAEADALIVPSFCYENSPTIIYEAASLSIPIIAAKIGGITELIEKFGGLLFTPNNQKELIEKMEIIKNDESLRKKIIARENEQIKDCLSDKYFCELTNLINPANKNSK